MRNLILATALVLATSASAEDVPQFIQEGDRPMDKARQDVVDFVNSKLELMGDVARYEYGECQLRCIRDIMMIPCVKPVRIHCWSSKITSRFYLELKFDPLRICTWHGAKIEPAYRSGFTIYPPRKIRFQDCKAD